MNNLLDKIYSVNYEILFYIYLLLIPFLYIFQTTQGVSLFPILYFITLIFWYKIYEINHKVNKSIYLIIVLFSFGILLSYLHREYEAIKDLLKFFSTIGIGVFCFYYNFKYLKTALFLISTIHIILYFITSDGYINNYGISYHSIGFSILTLWILYFLKEKPKELLLGIFILIFLFILRGRTHIFIGSFIMLATFYNYTLSINKMKFFIIVNSLLTIISLIILLFAANFILTENIISLTFLEDIITRGISANIRVDFWECYYKTITISSFFLGNINGYDQCVLETWALSFPDTVDRDVNQNYIQYENSFFRLNHKIGGFILLFYFLMFFGLVKTLLKNNLFIFCLIILFYIRMYTGDVFFFLPYDYLYYFILIIAFYSKRVNKIRATN